MSNLFMAGINVNTQENSKVTKKLDEYSKEELIAAVKQLKKRKKFGLVWEDKPELVAIECDLKLPVLNEVGDRAIKADGKSPTHLIIEGDNYHSLSALNYSHAGKIDAIYIDPPYNTGARDWKYNNDYVDSEDAYRHSKWLSFMDKRLRLAKNLLKQTGIIVVTIDDYEFATLNLLMDEIFGEQNKLGSVVIRNNPQGRSTVKGFSINHEYALFYGKSSMSRVGRLPRSEKQLDRYPEIDDKGQSYLWENFRKTGSDSHRLDRPKQFYPLYVLDNNIRLPEMEWDEDKKTWTIIEKPINDEEVLWPVDNLNNERVWKWGRERVLANPDHLQARKTNGGKIELYRRNYPSEGSLPNTLWDKPKYAAGSHGTNLLTKMFDKSHIFDFPKSLYAVEDCLRVCTSDKDAIVLDYFAGSGTTGHAILEMNKQDGGNRQFILCTSNENGIAENVTYERIKKVIEGYGKSESIPANVRYLKTDFVDKQKSTDATRAAIVERCTDLIRVRENTFEIVTEKPTYKIYTNSSILTAIVFDPFDIKNIWKIIEDADINNLPVRLYVFSYSRYAYEDEIPETHLDYITCPIPESVLEVYRRIFRKKDPKNV